MSNYRVLMFSFVALAVILLAIGCAPAGPEVVDVHGVVTLDGQPLDRANVVFQPANGRPSVGVTDKDGHYSLQYTNDRKGALPGSHHVQITSEVLFIEGQANSGRAELLPAKYHAHSELTADVSPENSEINFALDSK